MVYNSFILVRIMADTGILSWKHCVQGGNAPLVMSMCVRGRMKPKYLEVPHTDIGKSYEVK